MEEEGPSSQSELLHTAGGVHFTCKPSHDSLGILMYYRVFNSYVLRNQNTFIGPLREALLGQLRKSKVHLILTVMDGGGSIIFLCACDGGGGGCPKGFY